MCSPYLLFVLSFWFSARGDRCRCYVRYKAHMTGQRLFWGRHDRRWPKAGPEALAVAEQRAARLQSGLPAPLGQTVSPAHAMASAYKGHVQRSTPRFRRGRAPSAMGFALLDSTRSRPGVVHDCQNACGQHRVRFGQRGCNARPAPHTGIVCENMHAFGANWES